jgi:small subunit ribosomal protein S2
MAISSKVIRELLENGVHFGHQTNKWNPKMEKFIFGAKSGIYIIDLKKTEKALLEAVEFVYNLTASGKNVLFTGTKKQAKQIVREEAQRCGMFFVEERWLGGCLTNFATIRKSVDRLDHLQEIKASEVYETLAKKEKASIDRAEHKLLKNLEGIRDMKELPDCLIVVDAEDGDIAIKEANKIGIPVIALLDTNCDPDRIEYPIPGNDDAIRSIKYIITVLADAAEKGLYEFSGGKSDRIKKKEKKEEPEVEPAEKEDIETPRAEEEKQQADLKEDLEEKKTEETPAEEAPTEEVPAETEDEKPAEESVPEEDVAEGDIKLD